MSRIFDSKVMARHYDERDLLEMARFSVVISRTIQVLRSALLRKEGTISEYLLQVQTDMTNLGQAALDAVEIQGKSKEFSYHSRYNQEW